MSQNQPERRSSVSTKADMSQAVVSDDVQAVSDFEMTYSWEQEFETSGPTKRNSKTDFKNKQ